MPFARQERRRSSALELDFVLPSVSEWAQAEPQSDQELRGSVFGVAYADLQKDIWGQSHRLASAFTQWYARVPRS